MFDQQALLTYLRGHRLAVVSSVGEAGQPQSALVGIAVSAHCEVIFDTSTGSRKHANLLRDPRISLVVSGPGEQTLQLEGHARLLAATGTDDADLREIYYQAWPDGRERAASGKIAHWCIVPRWARYSNFEHGPVIEALDWP